jgi:hypothetical protein
MLTFWVFVVVVGKTKYEWTSSSVHRCVDVDVDDARYPGKRLDTAIHVDGLGGKKRVL